MEAFEKFFSSLTSYSSPHSWQKELAFQGVCDSRLIRIPTGFGKTLGVLAAWLWHRVSRSDEGWPRRLVWCLPMRVLVEQTEQEVRKILSTLGLLWDGGDHTNKVGVHLLMGGSESGEWHLYPEHCGVLIGTQDMLLSRALNRGYASPRARWPMEFGLLNQDCLWIMDEVQLMDVGLATSAQLQAFRGDDTEKGRTKRPCSTWWMSATLQEEWLAKSPDTLNMRANFAKTEIPAAGRVGYLWNKDEVSKPCRLEAVKDDRALARMVSDEHIRAGRGAAGPTLVVVNSIKRAVALAEALRSDGELKTSTEFCLVHSRFRLAERAAWVRFLNRKACAPGTDRIIVSTQVVEAGVDISAALLITELAPWASLVQRFGRSARWGGLAQVIIVDQVEAERQGAREEAIKKASKKSPQRQDEFAVEQSVQKAAERAARPYEVEELDAAREALMYLKNVAPLYLEEFEEQHPELLSRLYPFEPRHLLLRHELDELFDISSDLSGADIDISRFIRSGEERDLHVFWVDVPENATPSPDIRPSRDALCAVPFLNAQDWTFEKNSDRKMKAKMRAWVWDWVDGEWRAALRRDLYPGQTVLVATSSGGYLPDMGWSPDSGKVVEPIPVLNPPAEEFADASQDDESLSVHAWQTIAVHGREVARLAQEIALTLVPPLAELFDLAGRWHDSGKAFPAFQNSIMANDRPARNDLAKAPKQAWLPLNKLYPMPDGKHRSGFRHELASTLALFAVLQRHATDHDALLGPWRELLTQAGIAPEHTPIPGIPANILDKEIIALSAGQFNLMAYLICAHHGKVRLAWHACPADQDTADGLPRIRGLHDGEMLPALFLYGNEGSFQEIPSYSLDLAPAAAGLNSHTGAGWTERVLGLLDHHGPFVLAWLETLLRAADQRASRLNVKDELLAREVKP
ncbi:MAG: DEAD/DEAH box helicase [Syntrophobacteraceae bacterium]